MIGAILLLKKEISGSARLIQQLAESDKFDTFVCMCGNAETKAFVDGVIGAGDNVFVCSTPSGMDAAKRGVVEADEHISVLVDGNIPNLNVSSVIDILNRLRNNAELKAVIGYNHPRVTYAGLISDLSKTGVKNAAVLSQYAGIVAAYSDDLHATRSVASSIKYSMSVMHPDKTMFVRQNWSRKPLAWQTVFVKACAFYANGAMRMPDSVNDTDRLAEAIRDS